MIIVHNAAVGADGHVDAGFLEVFVPGLGHFDDCRSLAPADAFLFPGDADGTAADPDLHEVSAAFCQEPEAFSVHHVAGPYLDGITVFVPDPFQGPFLPFTVAFGGVDAQYVRTGFHQGRYPLFVVTGVDAGAYHVAFLVVQQFQGILFMGGVVFPEHHVHQVALFVDNGQGVQFVFPDDVIGLFQGDVAAAHHHVGNRGHEILHLVFHVHTADPVVTAGDDAFQMTVLAAVAGNGHGAVAGLFLQGQYIGQGAFRTQVGVADHEPGLEALDPGHHGSFAFDGLGPVDEGDAPFTGQSDGHVVVGYGLHDGGNQGNIQGQSRFFTFFEFHQRSLQTHICRDAFAGRISRN